MIAYDSKADMSLHLVQLALTQHLQAESWDGRIPQPLHNSLPICTCIYMYMHMPCLLSGFHIAGRRNPSMPPLLIINIIAPH